MLLHVAHSELAAWYTGHHIFSTVEKGKPETSESLAMCLPCSWRWLQQHLTTSETVAGRFVVLIPATHLEQGTRVHW